jgi:uracil-DNA glycosylase
MELWQEVPAAWREVLQPVAPDIARIGTKLRADASRERTLPMPQQVFRALQVPPQQVRVVILGQDPYPNAEHACGLAFSVPAGVRPLPPSLRNILDEVRADCGGTVIENGDLQPWVNQGVLLLNRTLTVAAGLSNSHHALGWSAVTDAVLKGVVACDPNVVAILWGATAQRTAHLFAPASVVASAHPSPLSAHRGFIGSRPFSRANTILRQRQQPPIRW